MARSGTRGLRSALLGVALLTTSAHRLSAQESRVASALATRAPDGSLCVGDLFPRLAGQTLSARLVSLPDTTAAHFTVVVFTFSRSAGDDARRWNDRFANGDATPADVDILVVAELEGAPRLMRGLITRAMRKSASPTLRDHLMVLDHDDALWKRRLSVTETSHAYLVLVRPDGRVGWISDGAFDEARYAQLRSQLP